MDGYFFSIKFLVRGSGCSNSFLKTVSALLMFSLPCIFRSLSCSGQFHKNHLEPISIFSELLHVSSVMPEDLHYSFQYLIHVFKDTFFCFVANNFVLAPSAVGYGCHAFGRLVRFVYRLLQKIKKSSSLHLAEQWQE